MKTSRPYTLLCLGDSYTIGEGVQPHERFSSLALESLKNRGVLFLEPLVIAQTGWTTDELAAAIHQVQPHHEFDFVTLLIGVNNQYRQRALDNYRMEFRSLLQQAITFAQDRTKHVAVLSIPDWGVTPFMVQDAKKRTAQQVSAEIDAFNEVNKEETERTEAHYIDITPISRLAATDASLTASDGLHPSAAMYVQWAVLLADVIALQLPKNFE